MAAKATIVKAELQVTDLDRHYYAAQTLRTMAMLASGIPSMTERFLVAAETSTNPVYAQMLPVG